MQHGIQRLHAPAAPKTGDRAVSPQSAFEEPRAGIKGDDLAEEGLGDGEAGLLPELGEDLLHVVEHLGASELGDDEVVGEKRVAEGLRFGARVEGSEELESEGRVLFAAQQGRKPEGRHALRAPGKRCHVNFWVGGRVPLLFPIRLRAGDGSVRWLTGGRQPCPSTGRRSFRRREREKERGGVQSSESPPAQCRDRRWTGRFIDIRCSFYEKM